MREKGVGQKRNSPPQPTRNADIFDGGEEKNTTSVPVIPACGNIVKEQYILTKVPL
jgi:hypothetical protein